MKKSKFTQEQIVKILQEAAVGQISQAELCTKHGVSPNTFYAWNRRYAGMETEDVKRLKELEAENAALKRIVANQALELEATGKLLRKMGFGPERRSGAEFLSREGLSKRRACRAMGISGSSLRYAPVAKDDGPLKERIQAVLRPGMGYRGARATFRNELAPLNPRRVHRLWKELRLNVRPKARKRRTGMPMPDAPTTPNEVWCLDFVHDACLNGTPLKILAVIDEFTRECLALEAATSIKAPRVRSILAEVFEERGAPKHLRSDNGPEFVSHCLAVWLPLSGVESRFTKPGSPWRNGKVESFNGKLRAELLNAEVFHNLADAQLRLRLFRRFYNEERPHSSLGYLTPATYRERSQESEKEEELYS